MWTRLLQRGLVGLNYLHLAKSEGACSLLYTIRLVMTWDVGWLWLLAATVSHSCNAV